MIIFPRFAVVALLSAGSAACGASTPATTDGPGTPPTASEQTLALAFDEVSFTQNGTVGAVLHADGRFEVTKNGRTTQYVTLHPDGRMVIDVHGKQVTLTLLADGSIKTPKGVASGVKIDSDGTYHAWNPNRDEGAITVHIEDDGTLTGSLTGTHDVNDDRRLKDELKTMALKGVTPKTRRAVSFLFVLMFGSGGLAPIMNTLLERGPENAPPPR